LILRSIYLFVISYWIGSGGGYAPLPKTNIATPDSINTIQLKQKQWADSILNTMSIEQKIGQLFIVAAYSNQNENDYQKLQNTIERHQVGGLIFMQGSAKGQAILTNRYQAASKLPLLICFDGEWGLSMRIKNVMNYPRAITLGAIQNNQLLHQTGLHFAEQFRRLGVHLNFAPCADVNTNANNPVVGFRAFGDNKELVAEKASLLMKGMQHGGLMASAKHFPGHGHSSSDSHYSLPKINKTLTELQNTELYPFEQLIKDSVMSILTGHLSVPALEPQSNIPSSLSGKVVTDLLKNKMNFKGIIFTDALNMAGSGKNTNNQGEVELKAFLAGNDMMLMPDNLAAGIQSIRNAIANDQSLISTLNESVLKILRAKYWLGLHNTSQIQTENIEEDLNNAKYLGHIQKLYENAVTLVENKEKLMPLSTQKSDKLVSVAIGAELGNSFQKTLLKFTDFQLFNNESRSDDVWYTKLLQKIDTGKTVVVSLHRMSWWPSRRFNVSPTTINFLNKLQKKCKVILVVLGNPYSLKYFSNQKNIVCGYEDTPLAQEASAQALFAAIKVQGKLPVNIENSWPQGHGLVLEPANILGYALPESVSLNSVAFQNFDRIINEAIKQKIIPGCNLLLARKGRIVYTNSYGNLTYDGHQKVTNHTIYDLASVTKVAATLQCVMKLYDTGKLDISKNVAQYLPELDSTNKGSILIENILLHQAGLYGYLPFWQKSTENNQLKLKFYREEKTDDYQYKVANNLYSNQQLKDSLWQWVVDSELITRRSRYGQYPYLYSDLGLIILQKVIERITGVQLNSYWSENFAKPLGLERTGFNIYEKIGLDQIAPTENDRVFRKKQIHGTVQDQHAAMMGGISGHAGLFGSLNDLAILMQMNLNKGVYNNTRFFSDSTATFFTAKNTQKSRRALGWDRQPDDNDSHFVSTSASAVSYGHSGYTGTMVWIDPKYDLVFVFLTNRVYPNANNNKLNSLKIRRKIHDVVYQAIIDR
jgi:beta-N-acetylhexosaminidase